jgi:hypothetical protein
VQARQKSIKDRLLQQVPVIGRDRLKSRAGMEGGPLQLTGAPNGFTASGASSTQLGSLELSMSQALSGHGRTNSRGDVFASQQQ